MMASPNNVDDDDDKQTTKRVVRRVVKTTTTRHGTPQQQTQSSVVLPIFCLLALVLFLYYSYQQVSRVSVYLQREESSPILVFDNVLSDETCQALHDEAVDFRNKYYITGKSVLFHAYPENVTGANYIEDVISSIIYERYRGQHFLVEYWVRQEWHHTIAHADMDENFLLLESTGKLRHPYRGHVLYLRKGSIVNGPTVVFANTTRGGEMYVSGKDTEMLIVPFVEGRLLQFDGDLLHAVPRPADLWLHPTTEELVHEPPEKYGRSVVLFNLWEEEEHAPMGLEFTSENMKMGKSERNDDHGTATEKTLCNPKSKWKEASIVDDWQESLWEFVSKRRHRFQLPLMGNEARRGTRDLTLELEATNLVEEALVSSQLDTRPKRVYLETPRYKQQQASSAKGTREL